MEISKEDSSSPIVFINRVDTYFGKILAQHLGTASPNDSNQTSEPLEKDDILDLNFLSLKWKPGNCKIFGSWHPVDSCSPYEPTVYPPRIPAVHWISATSNYEEIAKIIRSSSVCIFSLIDDNGENDVLKDALQTIRLIQEVAKDSKRSQTIILISTLMTWANTKQQPSLTLTDSLLVASDGNTLRQSNASTTRFPFSEEEFRRRKPHPSFRRHFEVEKLVLSLNDDPKKLLNAIVVASGVVYGFEENVLHWMFKEAWLSHSAVNVIGTGEARVAMIHARDLCLIVQNICAIKPRNRYLIAVDDGIFTLQQIAETISKQLSTGATESVSADELLITKQITTLQYDIFTTDMLFEPTTVKNLMKLKWRAQSGFVEALPRSVEEYRTMRNLLPIQIAVLGPPFSGKTKLARRLSEEYKLPYINVQDVACEAAEQERNTATPAESNKTADSKSIAKDPPVHPLRENKSEKPCGKFSDSHAIALVRDKLYSIPCQNQGFVLDGYPESYTSALDLFASQGSVAGHKEEEKEEEPARPVHDCLITPDIIFCLDATEDFLKHRMLIQPNESSNSDLPLEKALVQRFADHNFLTSDDDNVVAYFDQIEVPIVFLDVTEDKDERMESSLKSAMKRIGKPHNYGLNADEKRDLLRKEAEKRVIKSEQDAKQREFQHKLKKVDEERRSAHWSQQLQDIFCEEFKPKKGRRMPMREYLMTYVLPELTDGIIACITSRPADPIDFLAEYLLKNNKPLYLQGPVPFTRMVAKVGKKCEIKRNRTCPSPYYRSTSICTVFNFVKPLFLLSMHHQTDGHY